MLRQLMTTTLQRTLLPILARAQPYSAAASAGGVNDGKQPPNKQVLNHADVPIVDFDDPDYLPIPEYPVRPNEPLEVRKQRLLYQSRKRGMLENDLLLSTFAAKYLKGMSAAQTEQYDKLINGVTNDWDIYYWATNVKQVPPEHDNEIMRMLKAHVNNSHREQRIRQPNL